MTKRERAIKDRAWLKMKVFCITESLKRKMAADTSLTEKDKEWLSYIQNKVLIVSRKNPALWANIVYSYFSEKIGSNYLKWIEYLDNKGELLKNGSYKTGSGKSWPMSYCVPKTALDSGITKITFQRLKIQPPRAKPSQPTTDVVLEYAGKNLKRLTVAENLLVGPNAIGDAMVHQSCWMIFYGVFDVRRGANCRRLYHEVIEMVKEGRANLQLANSSEQLFEYDVKSCHPVLMLNLFTDPTERKLYSQLLDVDVYSSIAAVMQKALTRDEVKDVFAMAVNRSDRDPAALERNWVYQFFNNHFPTFTQQVLNVRTDMALFLQNEEAKLMVDNLGSFCMVNGFFWIPCHDGWMGTAEHEQQIISKVHDLYFSKIGYGVSVSKLELINRTSLGLFTYPLSGSYVYVNDTSPNPSTDIKVEDKSVVTVNPWKGIVDQWKQQNDPIQLEAGAIERAKARQRQKEGAKRAELNKETSNQLVQRIQKVMKKIDR